MSTKVDYYEVLKVKRDASDREISSSYRKLALKYHPDRNPGDDDAMARFKEAALAYEVLSDPEKRARYDRYGHAGLEGGAGGPQFNNLDDIFSAFGDIFGEGFADMFGGGGRRRGGRRVRAGSDVGCEVTLDLLEAARGCTRTLKVSRQKSCPTCSGSGSAPGSDPEVCSMCGGVGQVMRSSGFFRVQSACPSCGGKGTIIRSPCVDCYGKGTVAEDATIEVRIPAGVDDGMQICLRGEGNPSPDPQGPRGDCYVNIRIKEHPLFKRDGQHLICELPITYTQAVLGTTLEIPTLDGPESLDIPRGTPSGELFRLRGKGLPDPRHRGVGDLIVQVILEVPKKLNTRQEELLRDLAEEEHANVSPRRKSFFKSLKELFVHEEEASEENQT
ncbi:Chaperone protein DnaJ [Planctomycetales bacterium 10988]|nr:Chaperone protein DnaJ [Planctomycetales bacterium 10988]